MGGIDSVASSTILPAGVPAGIYPFTVIDQNSCTLRDTVYIYTPPSSLQAFSYSRPKNAICFQDSTVNIIVMGSGGTPFVGGGYLYNWYAVDDARGVCPESWHVPTDGEYTALSDYLGGTSVAGGKLKECTEGGCPESEYWYSPNTGATNESSFTALPGGAHYYYRHMGYNGSFWSSTEYGSNDAWHRGLESNNLEISRRDYGKDSGFSLRCIMDETEIDTILVPYSTGWNIVGLPVEVEDASYQTLFPNAQSGTLYALSLIHI